MSRSKHAGKSGRQRETYVLQLGMLDCQPTIEAEASLLAAEVRDQEKEDSELEGEKGEGTDTLATDDTKEGRRVVRETARRPRTFGRSLEAVLTKHVQAIVSGILVVILSGIVLWLVQQSNSTNRDLGRIENQLDNVEKSMDSLLRQVESTRGVVDSQKALEKSLEAYQRQLDSVKVIIDNEKAKLQEESIRLEYLQKRLDRAGLP